MYYSKYEENSEENNGELYDHINHDRNEWEDGWFLELDDEHDLLTNDKARTKNDDNKYEQDDVN